MDQYTAAARLGRTRPGGVRTACLSTLAGTLLASGCSHNLPPAFAQPMQVVSPYHITITGFSDVREAQQRAYDAGARRPFNQALFLQELRAAWPESVMAQEPANVQVKLVDYTATYDERSEGVNRALSMRVEMQGQRPTVPGMPEALLPAMETRCTASQSNQGPDLEGRFRQNADFVDTAWRQRNPMALTMRGQDQRLWDKLFSLCTRELASQYNAALLDPAYRRNPADATGWQRKPGGSENVR